MMGRVAGLRLTFFAFVLALSGAGSSANDIEPQLRITAKTVANSPNGSNRTTARMRNLQRRFEFRPRWVTQFPDGSTFIKFQDAKPVSAEKSLPIAISSQEFL